MRKVYLFGEICNERSEKFIAQMHELFEQSGEPITVYVNSCGGSVTDALAIYDVLQNAPCEIHIVGLGKVHSAAITVLLSVSKANRATYPNTEFMSHDISWKSDGPRAFLKDRVDQLERTVNQLLYVYTRDTNLSVEQARGLFFNDMADHYFGAEDALRMGFVSQIIRRETAHVRCEGRSDLHLMEPVANMAGERLSPINSSEKS
ncbi:MAG TPA: ATP-dependent Clp protease proteolytic subunit [Blastocatellia bacterium]|jgi:ATP-dependent Clp protease protease subunit|nr:ATP-dependent Clp protease proteolytic subunit [Blastocatellia bacterium]